MKIKDLNEIIKKEKYLQDINNDIQKKLFVKDIKVNTKHMDYINEKYHDKYLSTDFYTIHDYYDKVNIVLIKYVAYFMLFLTLITYILKENSIFSLDKNSFIISASVLFLYFLYKFINNKAYIKLFKKTVYFNIVTDPLFYIEDFPNEKTDDLLNAKKEYSEKIHEINIYKKEVTKDIDSDIEKIALNLNDLNVINQNSDVLDLDNLNKHLNNLHIVHSKSLVSIVNFKKTFLLGNEGDIIVTLKNDTKEKDNIHVFLIKIDDNAKQPIYSKREHSKNNLVINNTLSVSQEYYNNHLYHILRHNMGSEIGKEYVDNLKKDLDN